MLKNTSNKPTEYCCKELLSLQSLLDDDSLLDVDIANMVKDAMNKNIEKKILSVHVSKNGSPRKILTPAENRKGFWSTCTPDRKEIFATTREELFQKLYTQKMKRVCQKAEDISP